VAVGRAAVVPPTVKTWQAVGDFEPVDAVVVMNMKLRNQGVGVIGGADENFDQRPVSNQLDDAALGVTRLYVSL
jgi:hypothetical protein